MLKKSSVAVAKSRLRTLVTSDRVSCAPINKRCDEHDGEAEYDSKYLSALKAFLRAPNNQYPDHGLAAVLVIGDKVNGARRWVDVGFTRIQPSELAKILLILFFAKFIMDHKDDINDKLTIHFFSMARLLTFSERVRQF